MYQRIAQLLAVCLLSLCMFSYALGAETENWKLKIRVDGSDTYGYVVAGVRDTATDSHDLAWDVQAKLENLNENVTDPFIYVYFPHPEYTSPIVYSPAPDEGLNLSECIKDPFLPKEWIFEVDSNITGKLTITWPDLPTRVPEYQVSLTALDGQSSKSVNMQKKTSFSFQNTESIRRQFKLSINRPPVPETEPHNMNATADNRAVKLGMDTTAMEEGC
jgi:hypothetical protein